MKERSRKLYLILSHDIRAILDQEARRREAETGGKWTRTMVAESVIRTLVTRSEDSNLTASGS